MKPQLILLGAPGSGKGTQAGRLVSELSYKHLSTGDLLRKEISSGSDLGKRVTAIMDAGNLVDDDTVLELLNANCDLSSGSYIFDGFPRNIDQAKALDEKVINGAPSFAVYFEVDLNKLAERLVNRRTCAGCGAIYNLVTTPPVNEGVCDKCGSTDLRQRKDDNEETVKNRLKVFEDTISPILEYYQSLGRLKKLDASAAPGVVFEQLQSIVKE